MSRLIPIVAVLIAIGLFFGYISPTYRTSIEQTRRDMRNFDSALAAADRFKDKEAELRAARAAIPEAALTRLEAFLPDGVDNVQLILDLDALADRSGMQLSNFDTSEVAAVADSGASESFALANEKPVDSIDLTMNGTGTYASFRTFLSGIEHSLRPLDLIDVSISPTATGVYSYAITLRLYWLR